MRNDGSDGDHLFGFGPPNENSQIRIYGDYKLTVNVRPYSFYAHALRELFVLFINYLLFTGIFLDVLLVDGRWLGEFFNHL